MANLHTFWDHSHDDRTLSIENSGVLIDVTYDDRGARGSLRITRSSARELARTLLAITEDDA